MQPIDKMLNGAEDAIELAYEAGWTDGLPVVPPTGERVNRFLERLGRPPGDLIGEIPPKGGRATVEKSPPMQ